MNVPTTQNPERLPQQLADEMYTLAQALEHDRDVRRIVSQAREALAALSWARFARRHEQSDKAFRLRRRHQGHGHVTFRRVHAPGAEPLGHPYEPLRCAHTPSRTAHPA
jgi:hypothetical protein